MAERQDKSLVASDLPESLQKIRARTPARILMGRAGVAYRTNVQLELREAHAAARDAVRAELNLASVFGEPFLRHWKLFEVRTRAAGKDEYLLRPDLGRHFDESSRTKIQENCPRGVDLQIVIGDGLSVPALRRQVPSLLPLLFAGAESSGWKVGATFVIRYCRVGILNEIGELLDPRVVVLLIGERPGLATAESLSAYMAFRPRENHTDADRNLISNIHARGLTPDRAAARILNLAAQMMRVEASGCGVKEIASGQIGDGAGGQS
jgi:ethanolamine ammonia-lyase small subunit